jgi:hypothetical protein
MILLHHLWKNVSSSRKEWIVVDSCCITTNTACLEGS